MARIKLNAAIQKLSGSVDKLVIKQYGDKAFMSPAPNMSRVKASPAQARQREKMKQPRWYYQKILADPALRAQYEAAARAAGMRLYNFATREYMRRVKDPQANLWSPEPIALDKATTVVPTIPPPPVLPGPGAGCW